MKIKGRRLWPRTFLILSAGMLSTFAILVIAFFNSSQNTNLRFIRNRNRTTLVLSKEFIESRIDETMLDIEMLLLAIEGKDRSSSTRIIEQFLSQHPMWKIVHIVEGNGRILYSIPSLPELDGLDLEGMGYYKKWLDTGETVFHDLELTMMAPDFHPTVIGSYNNLILAAHIDLNVLAQSVFPAVEGDDIELSLCDSDGAYLLHPNPELVRDRSRNTYFDTIKRSYTGGVAELVLENRNETIHAHVTEIAGTGWLLGLYQNDTAIKRESMAGFASLLPYIGLFLVLLMMIVLLSVRLVTRPFARIVDQIVGHAGNTEFRFQSIGFHETDVILDALNKLVSVMDQQAAELMETRDKAEEANRTKDLFLANMSHELLTPLNGILGTAALLKEVSIDKEGTRLIGLQESAIDELHRLIINVLDYSQIQSGALKLNIREFRPAHLIESALEPLIATAREKGLDFRLRIKADPAYSMSTDPDRMEQILKHLVDNAVKFTDEGGIEVEFYTGHGGSQGDSAIIVVKDTGRGMPPEKIEVLLGRFTQGEETYVKTIRGAGMGLALIESLVQLLGGRVVIDSELSSGTIVTVRLPRRFGAAPAS